MSDAQVRELRRLAVETDVRQTDLARQFGISTSYVSVLVLGHVRLEAGGPIQDPKPLPRARLDDAQIREIRDGGQSSSFEELAQRWGLTREYIRRILRGSVRPNAEGPLVPSRARAQLTNAQVLELRELAFQTDRSYQDLAREFGVSQVTVVRCVRGKTFRSAGGPICPTPTNRKVNDEQVREIRRLARTTSYAELARRYNLREQTIGHLVAGRRRAEAGGPIGSGVKRKLSDAQVREIRALASTTRRTELARRFGVSRWLIHSVLRNEATADNRGVSRHRSAKRKLTDE